MVTHSTKAASTAKRVLFIKDGKVFHQLYRGSSTKQEMYQKISDTLTMIATGGVKMSKFFYFKLAITNIKKKRKNIYTIYDYINNDNLHVLHYLLIIKQP